MKKEKFLLLHIKHKRKRKKDINGSSSDDLNYKVRKKKSTLSRDCIDGKKQKINKKKR